MMVLILIATGCLLIGFGILLLPLAFAMFGDSIPDWIGDWGPLLSVALPVLGTVSIFAAILLGVAYA